MAAYIIFRNDKLWARGTDKTPVIGAVGVTQPTARYMQHRIRASMIEDTGEMLPCGPRPSSRNAGKPNHHPSGSPLDARSP